MSVKVEELKMAKEEKGESCLGVIIHWGLYSVPAFDSASSARNRHIQNGSEWYLRCLTSDRTSGWRETREFHNKNYGPKFEYADFVKEFNASKWNLEEWMTLFKSVGARYAIITAKHHDGFCLWKHAPATGGVGESNLLQRFADACRKHGLKFGIYYSWSEFGVNCTKHYMDAIVRPQIETLIKYKPDIFWFDGDWACTTQYSQMVIDKCIDKIKLNLPNIEINDRIGHKQERAKDVNYLGKSTYRVYEDRAMPCSAPNVQWEHINTIGLSWGRNKSQRKQDYKTASQLYDIYNRVASLGGRFLINVGPNADGTLDEYESLRLQELACIFNEKTKS